MRKKFLLIFLILSLSVLAACGRSTDGPGMTAPTEAATPTGTPAPTEAAIPTGTPAPTEAAAPTGTPAPTEAATPTGTPAPTETAAPTGTPAPTGITEPPEAVREEIKIAVIDTGISSSVIDSGRILEGKNYIEPQHDTEDRIGHGTALAAFIVGSVPARMEGYCPDALLVPLVYADMTVRRTDDAQTADGSDTDDAAQTADSSGTDDAVQTADSSGTDDAVQTADSSGTDDAVQTADSSGTDDAVQTMGGPELIAQAVRDAVDCYGCRIILISSGTQKDEPVLHEAVKYAKDNNVLVVSCAGNSYYTDTDAVYYPGSYDEVLCVGSLNEDGEPAYFSQRNEFVDVWEIGTDLRLATLKGTRIRGEGTSYSAAIVAGKAADLLAKDPGLTIDDLMRKLAEK